VSCPKVVKIAGLSAADDPDRFTFEEICLRPERWGNDEQVPGGKKQE
jgi:hypothetical protein